MRPSRLCVPISGDGSCVTPRFLNPSPRVCMLTLAQYDAHTRACARTRPCLCVYLLLILAHRLDDYGVYLLKAFEVSLKAHAEVEDNTPREIFGSPFGPYFVARAPVDMPAEMQPVANVVEPAADDAAPALVGGRRPKRTVTAITSPAVTGPAVTVPAVTPPAVAPPAVTASAVTAAPGAKKSRSGPSGESSTRKEMRKNAAAKASGAPPWQPPPDGRAVGDARAVENKALRVENADLKEKLANITEKYMTLQATVELREQLASATAKAACGGLMLTHLLGGAARAGPSTLLTPGSVEGTSVQQHLSFEAFFSK